MNEIKDNFVGIDDRRFDIALESFYKNTEQNLPENKAFNQNISGKSLAGSSIYLKLKKYRKGDDEDLSQGVWEKPIKKPEWKKIINITLDILAFESKDLQIAGWLFECLIPLYGISGLEKGLWFFTNFIKNHSCDIYPKDLDHQNNIIHWLDNAIYKQIMDIVILQINEKNIYKMHHWINLMYRKTEDSLIKIQEIRNAIIDDNNRNRMIINAKNYSNNLLKLKVNLGENLGIHLTKTNSAIDILNDIFCKNNKKLDTKESESEMNKTKMNEFENNKLINNGLKSNDNIFENEAFKNEIIESNLRQNELIKNNQNNSKQKIIWMNDRKKIYEEIKKLSILLKEMEPHSPSSYILYTVATWENKSLLEIIEETKEDKILRKFFCS